MMTSENGHGTEVVVTRHAAKRIRQRLGLNKRATQRHAQLAFDQGFSHAQARGRLKRHMNRLFLDHGNATNMRVYGEFIYLFAQDVLITVVPLPHNMKGGKPKAIAEGQENL